MKVEWILFCLGWALPVMILFERRRHHRSQRILASSIVILALGASEVWNLQRARTLASREQLIASNPQVGRPDGYISSDKCQACHPNEYESWHRTFHRTMTQVATPETVLGSFVNVELQAIGGNCRLQKIGNEFWAELDAPDAHLSATISSARRVRRRIGLLTGSHQMQVCWVPTPTGNGQSVFPMAWLKADQRWVPFENTFLRDPAIAPVTQTWNLNCINCHTTGGQPRPNPKAGMFETRVGELGIACEACHGPAEEHVRANQDPLRRYRFHSPNAADPTITNPQRLSAKLSSQICGQCHGIKWIPNRNDWLQSGFRFRPGQEMSESSPIVQPTRLEAQPWLTEPLKQAPRFLEDRYWSDGMVRVSGREYNGLIESPCFKRGDLSCLSCHSMHRSDPQNQLAENMAGNQACLRCHSSIRIEDHTRHRANSTGSKCYNCHMPYTTYGLLRAIRSHQIDSPSVRASIETGRPNACNLCHLDKTLLWTAQHLTESFGQKPVALAEDEQRISAALIWALKGDAGQRALVAWSMGWKPAKEASGQSWLGPTLAELLTDPYSAVRYIAHRSIKSLSEDFGKLNYDFVGSLDERAKAKERALKIWQETQASHLDRSGSEILIEPDGTLKQDAVQRLLQQRNNRSMDLQE